MANNKRQIQRRKTRVRSKFKDSGKVRLTVFRSNKNIHAQIIDDASGKTLASASTISKSLKGNLKVTSNKEAAKQVGKAIAEDAKKAGIKEVIFDRGSFRYHGRVKELAEGAREGGLKF